MKACEEDGCPLNINIPAAPTENTAHPRSTAGINETAEDVKLTG